MYTLMNFDLMTYDLISLTAIPILSGHTVVIIDVKLRMFTFGSTLTWAQTVTINNLKNYDL